MANVAIAPAHRAAAAAGAKAVQRQAPKADTLQALPRSTSDEVQRSEFRAGKAAPTTSLKNFSFANLGKGVGYVAAGGALVIGSAALISLTTKSSRAAASQIAKGIAADPGSVARALGPKNNNTMLYIGLGFTALMVGIYACQKHDK